MNADEVNKIAGAGIGALLVFLLLGFFSNMIFGTGAGGHHGDHEPLAFALEIEDSGGQEEAAEVDLSALVASADPVAGEKVFNKCKGCHKVADGVNGVGPHLWGVVGRDIASVSDFSYSGALQGFEGNWDLDHLSHFLENPTAYVSGTNMKFAGLKKPEDRVNVIAYLNEADGSPIELAAAPAETATDASEGGESHGEEAAAEAPAEEVAPAEEAAPHEEAAPAEEAATEVSGDTEVAAATPETDGGEGSAGGKYGDLIAAADAKAGKKVFRKCRACHKLDEGANGVGPTLHGLIGRDIAAVDGYSYSDALSGMEGDWTLDNLMAFLESPKGFAKGTKMAFPGVKDAQDRINLLTFINEENGGSAPLE